MTYSPNDPFARAPERRRFSRPGKKTLAVAGALVLGLIGTEWYGNDVNQTFPEPADSCVSPFTASQPYLDQITYKPELYTGILTSGVVAKTVLPKGVYGVEAGFKGPQDDEKSWSASGMLKPENAAGNLAVKFGIGNGQVEFGLRYVAHQGSRYCTEPPDVDFTHVSSWEYPFEGGKLPWPSVVNMPSNILAEILN